MKKIPGLFNRVNTLEYILNHTFNVGVQHSVPRTSRPPLEIISIPCSDPDTASQPGTHTAVCMSRCTTQKQERAPTSRPFIHACISVIIDNDNKRTQAHAASLSLSFAHVTVSVTRAQVAYAITVITHMGPTHKHPDQTHAYRTQKLNPVPIMPAGSGRRVVGSACTHSAHLRANLL